LVEASLIAVLLLRLLYRYPLTQNQGGNTNTKSKIKELQLINEYICYILSNSVIFTNFNQIVQTQ